MNKINTPDPTFNGSFYMMRIDGAQPYKQTKSDFKLTGKPVVANNSTTFNGTSTVTMKISWFLSELFIHYKPMILIMQNILHIIWV